METTGLNPDAVSFWQAQAPDIPAGRRVDGGMSVDVAIIGGGFAGLSTARELREEDAALSVAVLEADFVGYGASGRNGGFNMSLFGLEPEVTVFRWGEGKTRDAQHFMARAVSHTRDIVEKYGIDSDYEHPGMVRLTYTDAQRKRLGKTLELLQKLGLDGEYELIPGDRLRDDIRSPRIQDGLYERNSGIMNPFKQVRALKQLAEDAGADVFENSPVELVQRGAADIILTTPGGTVRCRKLVIAVNAWSGFIRGLPKIRNRQVPVWTQQVVTQPLTDAQWREIGWAGRQSIEDNRQFLHYFRRTACGRFTMGGGHVYLPRGRKMDRMQTTRAWQALEHHVKWMFPQLGDIRFDYRWGGPVSCNLDMTPEVGFIGDDRVIYANGCMGHGVSISHLYGRLIADLVQERKTALTDFWIVNRRAIPWPSRMLAPPIFHTICAGLNLWDRWEERGLKKSGGVS